MSAIKYYLTFVLSLLHFAINGQKLVSQELVLSLSEPIIEFNIGTPVETGVDAYRILYTTTDIEGRLDTASGLLLIPQNTENPLPMAIYQHGTVNSRTDVPSELKGGWELGMALSAFGFITVAPDYQGLGTSRGIHPYIHADSEGLAAVDLLIAVQDFISELNISLTDQLFITGYSQGGHAAMAAHQLIQEKYGDQFTVTASAPMSGPYSLSQDMIEFTLGDREFEFPGYLAWINLSFQRAYQNLYDEIGDIFKERYVEVINEFANEDIDLGTLNATLRNLIVEESGGPVTPKLMLREEILDIILTKADHPINTAFAENDVIDWAPQAPVRMMYCGMDEQVFFQNALTAEQRMTDLGATDVEAVLIDETGNHGSCVRPASLATIEFFRSFLDQTSFTHSPDFSLSKSIRIYPNPVTDNINIEFPAGFQPNKVLLIDSMGKLMTEVNSNSMNQFNVQHVLPGMYTLIMSDAQRTSVNKVLITK